MKKKLSREDVMHIAHLARLKLSEDEVELFSAQLEDIIGYVGQLNEIDLKDIAPTSCSLTLKNVFREDKKKEFAHRERLLDNAPIRSKNYYKVKKVIE